MTRQGTSGSSRVVGVFMAHFGPCLGMSATILQFRTATSKNHDHISLGDGSGFDHLPRSTCVLSLHADKPTCYLRRLHDDISLFAAISGAAVPIPFSTKLSFRLRLRHVHQAFPGKDLLSDIPRGFSLDSIHSLEFECQGLLTLVFSLQSSNIAPHTEPAKSNFRMTMVIALQATFAN